MRLRKSATPSSALSLETPEAFEPFLAPARYKGAHGGRGSGKSHFFALLVVIYCLLNPGLRVVCIREVQKTLKESVKRLIEDKIQALGVGAQFRVYHDRIETPGGGIIIFQGMQNSTAESIKSLEGFDIAWVEEAQTLSQRSLDLLRPTIRREWTKAEHLAFAMFQAGAKVNGRLVKRPRGLPASELWFSWNPKKETDPVDVFLRSDNLPPGAIVREVNWVDNPWFPDVLRAEMEYDRGNDLDKYRHVWLGMYLQRTEAQVLRGRVKARAFTPQASWNGPYFGADWGFSVDPSCLVKMWVDGRKLYIEKEAYGHQVDIDDTPALFDKVEGAKQHVIRADSARPETISYMQRHGYPRCIGVEKWSGSVEDGVEFLRSFEEIIVNPDCENTIREAGEWCWKVDRLTDDVLPVLVDKHDHIWDAARYGLAPLIKKRAPARRAHTNHMSR